MSDQTYPAALRALTDHGVSLWLDDLSRQRLRSGNLNPDAPPVIVVPCS
jgi:hypothetical protein